MERREFHKEIQKLVKDLNKEVSRRKLFKIARRMANGQNKRTGPIGLKRGGQLVTDKDEIKKIWMEYMEKLLNEENDWDGECSCNTKVSVAEKISSKEIEDALGEMKGGKAAGHSGVETDMIIAAGDWGVEWLTKLGNAIITECRIPEDWKNSILVPVYKGKGDQSECGSYRAIKLLEHAMKVIEKVLAKKISERVRVDEMQFGFTAGRGLWMLFLLLDSYKNYTEGKGKYCITHLLTWGKLL